MRKLLLVAALALLVVPPSLANAQQRTPPAPPVRPNLEEVSSAKVLAIGIGALLGAVAGQAIVAGDGITLVGGAAGGLLAAWWYDGAAVGPTRASLHERADWPVPAGGERLALVR